MTEPLLLLGWLLVSHLTADFVLQTDASVADRNGSGSKARRALGLHALIVAACMAPFWLAFGTPGLLALLVVAVPHPFVDAAKTRLTEMWHAATDSTEWSPWVAGLFLIDQAVHLALVFGAWWVFLRDAALNPWFVDRVAQARLHREACRAEERLLDVHLSIDGAAERSDERQCLPAQAPAGHQDGDASLTGKL